MPKVLFVCTVPTDKSGIPNVICNLLSALDPKWFHIGYVSINKPSELFKEKLATINASLYVIPREISHPLRYINNLSKVAREYDIIHVHGNSATMVLEMMAARISGVRVRIAHSHNTTCSMKAIDTIARPLFYRLCNGRLACGTEAGKWLFGDKNFAVINNGINIHKFRFVEASRELVRSRLGIRDEFIIGHIGNFVEQKNHSFLLDVFLSFTRLQPKTKLLLLGDGPLRNSIESKVETYNLTDKVIFAGSVDHPEEYMNAMDIVAMPSLFEGLPLTLIEEQANGLHIVAADTITPDANISGNVRYLPLSDCDQWALIIKNMLENTHHNTVSSEKAVEKIKAAQYDIESVSKNLSEYYYHLLSINS